MTPHALLKAGLRRDWGLRLHGWPSNVLVHRVSLPPLPMAQGAEVGAKLVGQLALVSRR